MSGDRHGWLDDAAAERLLRGEPCDEENKDARALAALLAAAASPLPPGPLQGEQAALAAFRVARAEARPWWRRMPLGAKAVISVAAAGLAFGGAAAVGTVSFGGRPDSGPPHPEASATRAAESKEKSRPSPAPGKRDPAVPGRGDDKPRELDTLCRIYTEGGKNRGEKTLEPDLLARLVAEAGGEKKVPGYCADRLAAAGEEKPGRGHPDKSHPGKGRGQGQDRADQVGGNGGNATNGVSPDTGNGGSNANGGGNGNGGPGGSNANGGGSGNGSPSGGNADGGGDGNGSPGGSNANSGGGGGPGKPGKPNLPAKPGRPGKSQARACPFPNTARPGGPGKGIGHAYGRVKSNPHGPGRGRPGC